MFSVLYCVPAGPVKALDAMPYNNKVLIAMEISNVKFVTLSKEKSDNFESQLVIKVSDQWPSLPAC